MRRGARVRALVRSLERGRALLPDDVELSARRRPDAESVLVRCRVRRRLPCPGLAERAARRRHVARVEAADAQLPTRRARGVARVRLHEHHDVFACHARRAVRRGHDRSRAECDGVRATKHDAAGYVYGSHATASQPRLPPSAACTVRAGCVPGAETAFGAARARSPCCCGAGCRSSRRGVAPDSAGEERARTGTLIFSESYWDLAARACGRGADARARAAVYARVVAHANRRGRRGLARMRSSRL